MLHPSRKCWRGAATSELLGVFTDYPPNPVINGIRENFIKIAADRSDVPAVDISLY